MTILLVQTFLLMLGAFLLGASLACLIRRGFAEESEETVEAAALAPAAVPAAAVAGVSTADTNRFGRALAGDVASVTHDGQPMIEVQPRPAAVFQPTPVPAPPERDVLPPAPEPEAEPEYKPAYEPEPVAFEPEPPAPEPVVEEAVVEPESEPEPSYTAIAVAAAAASAAAAAAAKAKADAEAEEARRAAELSEHASEEVATSESDHEASYTEIAVAAAAAAALAAAEEEAAAEQSTEDGFTSEGDALAAVPPDGEVDDFTRIRGIDAEIKNRLVMHGVHRFAQIAAWQPYDVFSASQALGFQGDRIESENWIQQAAILAAGAAPEELEPKAAAPVEPAPVEGDRLHRIIGIDPASEELLRSHGVRTLLQIASWTPDDVLHFEGLLGAPGRIRGEGWVDQAIFLTGSAAIAAATLHAPIEAAESSEAEEPPPAPESDTEPFAAEASAFETDEVVEGASPEDAEATKDESYLHLRSVKSEALRGEAYTGDVPVSINDLKRIRGIGVLIEKKLYSLGITSYEQVANWTRADIDRISQILDFKGRIERENWIEQARILASGGQTEFSRRVDRGDA